MPKLYPETLFHFTNKDGLFEILETTFKLSYARERIEIKNGTFEEFGAPMVSFCDLRLSELKDHMDKYGKYGIGMSKAWANKKGLNPVFYVNRHSPLAGEFFSAVKEIFRLINSIDDLEDIQKISEAYMNIFNTYRYIKNYEGTLIRKNRAPVPNYRFADEREWRYVPPLSHTAYPFVPSSKIATPEAKRALNQTLGSLRLTFSPRDIKYLVVERDSQRIELINHLQAVKGRFPDDVRRKLASRILTAAQIRTDM